MNGEEDIVNIITKEFTKVIDSYILVEDNEVTINMLFSLRENIFEELGYDEKYS